MGRASKKVKESSEEEEEEQQEEQFDEDDEDDILEAHPEDLLDENERNEALLGQIQARASESPEDEQLTWNAIYALKKKEGQLTQEMNTQIEAIKEKYELLKQPLYKQISNVALGIKVDAKLYKPEGLPCRGDPSKVQPVPIPNFWLDVLDKEGLLSSEVDVECFSNLKQLSCELIDHKTNHVRIIFKFKSATEYFSNTELQVDSKYDTDKNQPSREIKSEIKYKKDRQETSIFTVLFDSKTEIQETYSFASEFYQDYTNAVYFFFREDQDDEAEDDEEGDEEEEDEDSEEVKAVENPKKKSKQQPKKQIEKPECKQQ